MQQWFVGFTLVLSGNTSIANRVCEGRGHGLQVELVVRKTHNNLVCKEYKRHTLTCIECGAVWERETVNSKKRPLTFAEVFRKYCR